MNTPSHNNTHPGKIALYAIMALVITSAIHITCIIVSSMWLHNPIPGQIAAFIITGCIGAAVWSKNTASAPQKQPVGKNAATLAVISCLFIILANVFILGYLGSFNTSEVSDEQIRNLAWQHPTTKNIATYITVVLTTSLIGPAAEEMFFRGGLHTALKKFTPSIAIATMVSASTFAISHADPIQIIWTLPAGILFALVYELTGSLVLPIILHIIYNTTLESVHAVNILLEAENIFTKLTHGATGILFITVSLVGAGLSLVSLFAHVKNSRQGRDEVKNTWARVSPAEGE
jgi:membrane protease YdiL (CAAX protease family)